jgi:hypothetical protein
VWRPEPVAVATLTRIIRACDRSFDILETSIRVVLDNGDVRARRHHFQRTSPSVIAILLMLTSYADMTTDANRAQP